MREFFRVPCSVAVEYRSAASFLVAYAANLSRGGVFLETRQLFPVGSELLLRLAVGEQEPLELATRVAWIRDTADEDGPVGMGLEFVTVDPAVGKRVDAMVGQFRGIKVALLARDGRSNAEVGRSIRAAIASAELIELSDASFVEVFGDRCDLLVVDADSEPDGGVEALRAANLVEPALPTIVLSSDASRREAAERGGATALGRPPSAAELGKAAIRALAQPLTVK